MDRGLYNRILKAYEQNRPLLLRSGDVMMLRHYFEHEDLRSQDGFELRSARGGQMLRERTGDHEA